MKGVFPLVGRVIVGLALLASFGIDWANTEQGGAVDLRNRITGVRLLERGIDPYHYKWHEGDPPEYIDLRNNPALPVSKTTVTPALLLLHLPFAALPYRVTQFLWLFAQWLMLLGTGWLWWRACTTPLAGWLVALFMTGLTYTAAWRWEAERGQAYLLLAFLFSYWQMATMDPKRGNGFVPGCVMGFLVALRPPFLLLLPFLALHRRGQLLGVAAGLLFGFGLPMLMSPNCWTDYFSAMQTFSHLYRYAVIPPHGPALHYPPIIEGIPIDTLGHLLLFHNADFSVHGLLRWLGLEPFPDQPLLLAVAAPFAVWLWWTRAQPVESLPPGLAAWFFLSDLFLPAFRFSYHDLFILNVVLCGLVTAKKIPWATWPCLLALPLGWAVYVFWPASPWWINAPAFFFTVGAIMNLFSFRGEAAHERSKE
ncbi:MAG: glycosyltransferase 87 family protein [Methylacidiphilales bacterium]|nr:glycosyltransferase 87 family protein [Candidatus Methylacidiphilales bacterium]